jgi:small neutral amino acid transporter SnatA (MarC family)
MILPPPAGSPVKDVTEVCAAQVAFPGLFPPIAVALPMIYAAASPTMENKAIIFGLGMLVLALDWLAMRYSKAIVGAIGPTPLQLT